MLREPVLQLVELGLRVFPADHGVDDGAADREANDHDEDDQRDDRVGAQFGLSAGAGTDKNLTPTGG